MAKSGPRTPRKPTVRVDIDFELDGLIDQAAKVMGQDRADFIRETLAERVEALQPLIRQVQELREQLKKADPRQRSRIEAAIVAAQSAITKALSGTSTQH